MDIATIIGLVGSYFLVVMGTGFNLGPFIDMPSVYITLGGTVASMFTAFPMKKVLGFFGVIKNTFVVKNASPAETIKVLVGFAEQARREGILALESRSQELTDPFLKKGIQLAVDGTEPDLIKDILNTEISFIEQRHKYSISMLEFGATIAPAFGMIGTLLGLVLMLGNMSDPDSIGPNMAVALITTLYGSLFANTICTPMASKLAGYSSDEVLIKELMLEGIMSLQSGDNPRIVEQKLIAFLQPNQRTGIIKEEKK
jgi:chemotaxis protein MotA